MNQHIVSRTEDGSGYKYMEDGRPVFGARAVARFDEQTAQTVARQLGNASPVLIIGPADLLKRFVTHKVLAEKMGCSLSTVGRWVAKSEISAAYLLRAHELLASE